MAPAAGRLLPRVWVWPRLGFSSSIPLPLSDCPKQGDQGNLVLTEVFRFSSATERRSRWNKAIPTYPSLSPRGALDRIYYRGIDLVGARRYRLSLSRVASDHLPVIGDFVLGATPAPASSLR